MGQSWGAVAAATDKSSDAAWARRASTRTRKFIAGRNSLRDGDGRAWLRSRWRGTVSLPREDAPTSSTIELAGEPTQGSRCKPAGQQCTALWRANSLGAGPSVGVRRRLGVARDRANAGANKPRGHVVAQAG